MDKQTGSRIIDDARKKIADTIGKEHYHHDDWERIKEDKQPNVSRASAEWVYDVADQILNLSGTTDIDEGNNRVAQHKWKTAVVLENGELPELPTNETQSPEKRAYANCYRRNGHRDMLNAGYVKEVRQVVE